MAYSQAQLVAGRRPVEDLHRKPGIARQPGAQPEPWVEGQVRAVDQQQRGSAELMVVVVDPRAQFAAQPGMKEHLLKPCGKLALPAQFQIGKQRHQQVFAERCRRVQGHGLVQVLLKAALGEGGNGLFQLLTQALPVAAGRRLRCTGGGVQQGSDLADRGTAVEPGENLLDALDVFLAVQAMPLASALRHDQAITAFPGAQGDRVDAGQARHLADRQQRIRWHCAGSGFPGAVAGIPAAPGRGRGGCVSDA
ncbi:hypothetical protein D3C79_540780 [compost metagenome]